MRRDIDCALIVDPLGGAVPIYRLFNAETSKVFVLDKTTELIVNELDNCSDVLCPLIECKSVEEVGRCGNFHTDPEILEGIELLLTKTFLHDNVPVLQAADIIEAEEKATSFFIEKAGCKPKDVDVCAKQVFYSRDDMKIYSFLEGKDVSENFIMMFGPEHRFKLKALPENRIIFTQYMEFLGALPITDVRHEPSYGAFTYHMKHGDSPCANIVAVDIV